MNEILDTGLKSGPEFDKKYGPAPYYAKVLGTTSNSPSWDHLNIGIFERAAQANNTDRLIGEYKRNYASLFRTFHPFELRGKWYALYSKDYSHTSLMELPSCKDIGDEIGDGFCPTDYFVPPISYKEYRGHQATCPRSEDRAKECTCTKEWDPYIWHFPDRIHGFVAGCYWGDDSSWKIQYLDLSRADEGIVVCDERFGYVHLPEQMCLAEAISTYSDQNGISEIRLTIEKHFCLATGKYLD